MNDGKTIPELVILKSTLNLAALPRKEVKPYLEIGPEYLVNEDDARLETIDEFEEFPGGTSQEKTVDLEAGDYVLFSNLPGDYDRGMYAPLHIAQE